MRHLTVLSVLVLSGCATQAVLVSFDQLHPQIRSSIPDPADIYCKPTKCGDVVSIDCQVTVDDGPQTFFNNKTGHVLMYCGGSCQPPISGDPLVCKTCPPQEWTCPVDGG